MFDESRPVPTLPAVPLVHRADGLFFFFFFFPQLHFFILFFCLPPSNFVSGPSFGTMVEEAVSWGDRRSTRPETWLEQVPFQ